MTPIYTTFNGARFKTADLIKVEQGTAYFRDKRGEYSYPSDWFYEWVASGVLECDVKADEKKVSVDAVQGSMF